MQQCSCARTLWLRPASAFACDFSLGEKNFVDRTVTDQTSIIHFVEDNWLVDSVSVRDRSTAFTIQSRRCSTSSITRR